MILGSGLGTVADKVERAVGTPYAEIEGFPRSSVAGHAGKLVAGTLAGKPVVVMAGRAHLYEGTPVSTVVFPVRVMKALGVEILLVTNAAGGLNGNYLAGSFMIIKDHINLLGVNPLAGPNDERFGPRFPDMTVAYDAELREKAKKAAVKLGMTVPEGVYAAMPGPSYETPAEIRMLRGFGADAVGMSTVPEVIAARHCGMRVVGISFISNAAAGLSAYPLTHEEVQREADKARAGFEKLVLELVAAL
jgi:purine-nucleoside phosphorylase